MQIIVNNLKIRLALLLCGTLIAVAAAACNRQINGPPPAAPLLNSGEHEIVGKYAVSGKSSHAGSYEAELAVTKQGEAYRFSMKTGADNMYVQKNTFEGTGITSGNIVGVTYSPDTYSEECGVAVYSINADGSLDGKSTYSAAGNVESERASLKSGEVLNGNYEVSGTNLYGERYVGTLRIKRDGEGYGFWWDTGRHHFGFGMRFEDKAVVGFGRGLCSFAGYQIRSEGTLDGKWSGPDQKTSGTETAIRK